ncbi:MAG: hypothetical protein OEW58_00380 [Gammaproteobacteria bacterium]|nr:hypothetical protein [Gammaproteobacteria bacterium]
MLYCQALQRQDLQAVLGRYAIDVIAVADGEPIPGSFWGDSEAGIIANRLYVRGDTPVHSALHEACHYICLDHQRRKGLHTDAGGGYDEENGVCYLQLLLSDQMQNYSMAEQFLDMDEWGYSFRLGSARAWFEQDAEDAFDWLRRYGIVDQHRQPSWRYRDDLRDTACLK